MEVGARLNCTGPSNPNFVVPDPLPEPFVPEPSETLPGSPDGLVSGGDERPGLGLAPGLGLPPGLALDPGAGDAPGAGDGPGAAVV
jgi:hypothetical protein